MVITFSFNSPSHFLRSSLATEALQTRVNKLDLIPTLRQRPEDFSQRMMSQVYPLLDGVDHRLLTYFFSLLDCDTERLVGGLTSAEHLALLKKFKPIQPGKIL